jgi:subtilisin family serine protease
MSRHTFIRVLMWCSLVAVFGAGSARAAWLWDTNNDKIDDRIAQVESGGALAARVGGLASGKLRFALVNAAAPFRYGVYIGYDHHPTDADALALQAYGVTPLVRYQSIDYIRAELTAAQAVQVAALTGITRIETIPLLYAVNDVASRALRARESDAMFPSVWSNLGYTGRGVSVAILDTGVNDEADATTGYPGHESLRGKFLGGGNFFAGQPLLNTPLESSENPKHILDPEATYHGTHVAGTAIGSGGPNGMLAGATPGTYAGVAPDARLIDCKVLSDAGVGFGAADALDWLIHHRSDYWGLTGADTIYRGVDVASMSLGGTDNSDGTDASCGAVNAAVRAGITVVVATGNDGNAGWIASPCAADLAVSVGSFTDDNTVRRTDDYVADYSNEGPRLSDGDSEQLDEMKPSVLGPGTGIMSALGDPTTNGRVYHHINGTSMATPAVSGVAALVLSANPGLQPDAVRRILQETADHRRDRGKQPESAADPFGIDPNYHPSWGWGETDAYAAVKEALNPASTQIVRFALEPQRGPDGVVVRWWAQREIGLTRYRIERAPDAYGGPGAWQIVHDLPVGAPVHEIARNPNRRPYAYTDSDPSLVASATYWYRVTWVDEAGITRMEPEKSVRIEDSAIRARVQYAWTHNYSDGDLAVRIGTGTSTGSPVWWRAGQGAQAADSVVTLPGIAFTGTLKHYFHVDLTDQDLIGGYLPPSAANPWFLSVKEGGFINTLGKVDAFSVTVFGPGGTTTYTSPQTTVPTVEKQETVFWIPLNPAIALNHTPVIQSMAPASIGEGLMLRLTLAASDPDGQPLTESVLGLPSGATFDPGTHRFEWTPGFSQAGSYTVRFVARDNAFPTAAADTETVSITVVDRAPGDDQAPIFDALSDRSGIVGERTSFRVHARDPEGSAVTYAITNAPLGATLDPATGAFEWTPGFAGTIPLTFTSTDPGSNDDTLVVVLVVSDPLVGPPPPSACQNAPSSLAGVVDAGSPVATTEVEIPFTAPDGVQRIEGTLTWFAGPVVDLDLYLLDADHNVVHSSASNDPSEQLSFVTPVPGQYYWRVVSYVSPDTAQFTIDVNQCVAAVTGAGETAVRALWFAPPAPNPFRSTTRLSFGLPRAGEVSLRIYDLAGRRIRTLQEGMLEPGLHSRTWDRRTDRGDPVSAGVYFARLVVGGVEARKQKVVLMP